MGYLAGDIRVSKVAARGGGVGYIFTTVLLVGRQSSGIHWNRHRKEF